MPPAITRFAPSPTGELHVGSVRTALFSWLTAKSTGGKFFIRFEDTDQERYVPGSARRILEQFDWLGITLDGGPDHEQLKQMKADEDYPGALADGSAGGIPGPFVQSQRLAVYKQHAEMLIASGHAYRANETSEELEQMRAYAQARKEAFRFKEHMRIRTEIDPGTPHVIRLRIPNEGQTRFHDLIKGDMTFENINLDDPVILKTDGYATYHLAAMVDDHLMGVTHIIRSDEWLPSAPKHIHLFKCLGWEPPQFAHVPTVNGADGKKLSKRHGATGIFELRDQGYLPEALINFLAMLGWAPGQGSTQNIFSVDELFKQFNLSHVGSSPAVFEYPKLEWMNDMHIRALQPADLAARIEPFMAQAGIPIDTPEKRALLVRLVPLLKERVKRLTEAPAYIDFFFNDIETPPTEQLIGPKMEQHLSLAALKVARLALADAPVFEDAQLETLLRDLCAELLLKPAQLFTILRNAVSGKSVTPPLTGMIAALGRETTLTRLDRAIAKLQGS